MHLLLALLLAAPAHSDAESRARAALALAAASVEVKTPVVPPPQRVHHDGGWWVRKDGRWVPEEPGWKLDPSTGRWYWPQAAPPVQAPVIPAFQPGFFNDCPPGGT